MENLNSEALDRVHTEAKTRPSRIKGGLYALLACLLIGATLAWLLTRTPKPTVAPAVTSSAGSTAAAPFDVSSLEARLSDAQQVNRVLREQALALSQRLDLVEETMAGLRRGAAPSAESFKLDEAQYLLSLAETRLDLFSDPASAVRALELSDQLLASISDPALASVRQTLSIELDVVRAAPITDVPALSGRLRALTLELANLPILIEAPSSARSRLWGVLDRYLVVRREGEAMPVLGRSAWAVREGLTLEFERAQLALERQQPLNWQSALSTAVTMGERALVTENAVADEFMLRLRALAKTELAPQAPKLGATLRALRRLREGDPGPPIDAANPLLMPQTVPLENNTAESNPPESNPPESNPVESNPVESNPSEPVNDAPATPIAPAGVLPSATPR